VGGLRQDGLPVGRESWLGVVWMGRNGCCALGPVARGWKSFTSRCGSKRIIVIQPHVRMGIKGRHQGCYGLQSQLTISKFADTISKILQMERCRQICRSAIL
jgi:hypothetical protein